MSVSLNLSESEKVAWIAAFEFDSPPSIQESIDVAVIRTLDFLDTSDPENRIYSNETKIRVGIDLALAQIGIDEATS